MQYAPALPSVLGELLADPFMYLPAMSPGEVIKDEYFQLYDSVSAIEVGIDYIFGHVSELYTVLTE